MTTEALKALCYDQIIELNRIQNNIKLIEQEIISRPNEQVELNDQNKTKEEENKGETD